jgi:hypothetical protein
MDHLPAAPDLVEFPAIANTSRPPLPERRTREDL